MKICTYGARYDCLIVCFSRPHITLGLPWLCIMVVVILVSFSCKLLHSVPASPPLQGMAIIVKEGDHLKLTCAATGKPKPQISWNLKNGHAIPDGGWKRKYPTYLCTCPCTLILISTKFPSVLTATQKKQVFRRTTCLLGSYQESVHQDFICQE